MSDRPILLIDAFNLFIRNYARNPTMSTTGQQAGGIIGFFNSLKYLVELALPKAVIVAWEGGGSTRRRALYPAYKSNRRPPRLNRYYEDDIPDTHQNKMHQVRVLVDAMMHLPICQLFIEDCEADDIIGYLCRNKFYDQPKIIASSDRDFYQLLDDKTMQYTWSSRKFIGPVDVLAETGISTTNIVLARAVCGDRADNLLGVKGVGFKTLAKRIPRLALPTALTVQDLLDECSKMPPTAPKMYSNIISNAAQINLNRKIMYLDVSNLAAIQVRRINAGVESFVPSKNKMKLMKLMLDEGLGSYDIHDLFSAFCAI